MFHRKDGPLQIFDGEKGTHAVSRIIWREVIVVDICASEYI